MKNISTAARQAGVNNIECPACKRTFNTAKLLERVFQGILQLALDGEVVNVPRFGQFRPMLLRGRSNKTPLMDSIGGAATWGDRIVLKFKQSAHTRRFMNPDVSEAQKAIVEKAAKTRARNARRDLIAAKAHKESVRQADRRKRAKKKAAKKAAKKKAAKKKAAPKKEVSPDELDFESLADLPPEK
jgi:hypothetical protein